MVVSFKGAPGYTYQIERTSSLATSDSWEAVGFSTVDDLGHGVFIDLTPPAFQGFYRTKQ